jgi:hypothetical protein
MKNKVRNWEFKINIDEETTRPSGRTLQFPLTRIIQIPLNILTKKNLTKAERIIAIELYRMRKEEKLKIIKKGKKINVYLGGEWITEEDLAKKIGFSKSTVNKTLQKLWH